MGMGVKRFEVYLVNLDPTLGSEIQKTRPCVVVSPDEMNQHIRTVIVAPMTTKGREYRSVRLTHSCSHRTKLTSYFSEAGFTPVLRPAPEPSSPQA